MGALNFLWEESNYYIGILHIHRFFFHAISFLYNSRYYDPPMQYCSRNSTPIQFRISSDICIKGSCGKFGRCYQFFSGGNMFSTCTCFAGKSFSSSTGCLILLCTNLDDWKIEERKGLFKKNSCGKFGRCYQFYSGGNMFSTCTCFAGKSFLSSTGCLILRPSI